MPWLRSTGRLPEALTEQQDPDHGHPAAPMFKAIRDQFPNDVSDAHVLDAAAKAHAEGIRPDQAKVLIQEDRAWVASTQVPGFRVHVGLSAAAPALVDSLERSNQLETQQQEQQRHDTLAMGR
ncbi:hypothetical protein OK348_15290 [Flavobacterium sp. MXW15]|uniref:DSBA-like thioredoxin domain-containing protein n=1 Tax=Xanthomonas chitinilytica TaxID=2989819 RepID=A0ABT3K003_9XANT|nr:hypothetical protein [Xanthomonas sp. H13-6]MCW4456153.1 hypothetical protein [Flavobacterium sp. MXW15]MCW4473750.1 hypothetical protein [Xanthomonas sp. H13-6]